MNHPRFTLRTIGTIVAIILVCVAVVPAAGPADITSLPNTAGLQAPVAGFTADRITGTAPFTVQFTDTSTGVPTAWYWDFGDGSTSARQNPSYTYRQPGTYTVTLTVKNRGGSSAFTSVTPVTILARVIVPDPDFTTNTSSGRSPLAVQFTDTSAGTPISWAWDFDNDGSIDSHDQNPVCVYIRPGNYTANLTVTNAFRTKTIIRTDLIQVGSRAPIAMYTANVTTGTVPLAVQFTNISAGTNITGWAWDFDNDGIIDSHDQNPVCVYKRPGNYTVRLTVTNEFGANTTAGSGFVMVTTGMLADFSANISSGLAPLAVQFMDNSTGTGITGWAWDFDNDSVIDSRNKNPSCVYTRAGDYTVLHTVFNTYGSDTVSGPGYITVTTGMISDFSTNITNGTFPLAVQFTDASTGTGITGWAWDFDNDGIIDSRDKNPVCVYNQAGNYTVSLGVTNARGTNRTVRQGRIVVNTWALEAGFTANATTGIPPLAVQFTDASTGTGITGWAWDFDNDGIIDSRDKNPVCVYNRPGNYTVSLRVLNEYGSNTTSGMDFIALTNDEPKARFAVNRTTGIAPLAVQFKDISSGTNITGRAWDFDNDGTIDSHDQNPVCVYNRPGTYTITFSVTNTYGSNTFIRKDFVTAT